MKWVYIVVIFIVGMILIAVLNRCRPEAPDGVEIIRGGAAPY